MLRTINGTVLAAGTAEADLKVGEFPFNEPLHVRVHKCIDAVQERQNLSVIFEELDHFLVHAGKLAVILELARVVHGTTVEDIASSIALSVCRNAFLVGETEDFHLQALVLGIDIKLLHRGQLGEDL